MRNHRLLALISLCLALLWLSACATGESTTSRTFQTKQPDKVALVDISGDIRGDAPKNQVEDFFTAEMLKKGYRVIERSRVNKVLAEQDFQHSDRTTAAGAAAIGKVLNVPGVFMLDVNVDGEKLSITGKIIDTETAEILWVGTGRGGSGSTVGTIGGAILGAVAGSAVGDGSGRTAAMIGGGVLGGAAGDALTPQTARVAQRAVQEMVKELPPAQ
ncbi:MAG: glycine zipper 2TM domain-containing protein [Desulfobacteraceae bacterium]|nr:glycine zipper 2TM domain-containing protein [Desulfobacteraceae bacterium]